MADFINQRLGNRYDIRERIGAGGMARVFKAWDINLDRWVAVKILHDHLVDDPSFSERFAREAKLVASLNHPNIVQIYDYSSFQRDGETVYYMVMPYVSGKTLRSVLDDCVRQKAPMPRGDVLIIIRELLSALAYAHDRGMVHRDVKPGNVLIDEDSRVILTDFGIARMIESTRITQDSITTGTPAYMSPEQVTGGPGDARSDLYSLGIMMYEMLTGTLPYTDEGGLSLVMKHLNAPVPKISDALNENAPELDRLIAQSLAKDPDERIATAAEFAAALRAIPETSESPSDTLLFASKPIRAVSSGTTQAPAPGMTVQSTTMLLRRDFSRWAGILAVIIVLVLLTALLLPVVTAPAAPLTNSSAPSGSPTPRPTIPPEELNQEGFTANFSAEDPDNARWNEIDEGGIERHFDFDAGVFRLSNMRPGSALNTLVETDKPYGNVTISMVARLTEDGGAEAGYGIVFRYQDEDNYNVFAVDGSGRYSIWVRSNGVWEELRRADVRWTPDDVVLPLGEANRLRINVTSEALTGYINNQPIVQVVDNTFQAGAVGIYLAAPDTGSGTIEVDLYEVYPIIPSMTESIRQN